LEGIVVLFLIGAGFNIDAGSHRTSWGHEFRYPLINDVARLCFDLELSNIPHGRSIEDLFADAQDASNSEPMRRLTDILMDADHYIAGSLAQSGGSTCYSQLFDRFVGSNYLTFNYDSLLEILLLRKKQWFPDDGFGVPAQTSLQFGVTVPADQKSASKVFHLHGSLCLNFTEFDMLGNPTDDTAWLDPSAPTRFMFDPGCLNEDFWPYLRVAPSLHYQPASNRVIAPVPNKGSLLTQKFSEAIYEKARALTEGSGTLISIGYSFNSHDRESYDPILRALDASQNRRLVLISPDAGDSVQRINACFPGLNVSAIATTFKEWASTGFSY
jgi:SIR2-like domain